MKLLCSKVLQICSSQLDMEGDSFNEQSGELSFDRIIVPLVLEPSYCSYNHSMIIINLPPSCLNLEISPIVHPWS